MFKNVIIIWISLFLLLSCTKKDVENLDPVVIEKGGVFIVNEGNFSVANSSLSYYYPDTSSILNNLFYKTNNVPLGDVAQSITIHNDMVFIVINNSGLIYGLNSSTLKYDGKINGLISPREIAFIDDNKAYVSDLFSTSIAVVDPKEYTVTGSIEIGKSSDCMISVGDKTMIANWSAYNQTTLNNTVMVIDNKLDMLTDSIVIGIEPNSMVIDKYNQLWVLCSGGFMNDEKPTLWKIDVGTLNTIKQYTFSNILQSPDNLCINGEGDSLYFLNSGVWGMSVDDQQLPDSPIIDGSTKNYYSLGINPLQSDIYVSDALDYNQNGIVYRYTPAGKLVSEFQAGIIPGCFGFNN